MQTQQIVILICIGLGMFAIIGGVSLLANYYTLNGIKSKTVGDGQHGTARFATEKEIRDTYKQVPYEPERWRRGEALPTEQGLVVGYKKRGTSVTALVDSGDIHCLMIGAAGQLFVSQHRICLCFRHELALHRHQGRSVP